jgi:hypothetical protein
VAQEVVELAVAGPGQEVAGGGRVGDEALERLAVEPYSSLPSTIADRETGKLSQ